MSKINWEEIRNKYVYGIAKDGKLEFPSQKDLSEEYNIAPTTVAEHSKKENWVKLREDYLSERRVKGEQKVIEAISNDISEFDIGLFNQAKAIKKKLDYLIEASGKNPYQLSCVSNMILTLKNIEKSVIGESNNGNSESIKVIVSSEDSKKITEKILNGEKT